MAAAVTKPCGLACVFAFLMFFFFVLTTQNTRFCQTSRLLSLIGNAFAAFEGAGM
jgi:hypothetical protein